MQSSLVTAQASPLRQQLQGFRRADDRGSSTNNSTTTESISACLLIKDDNDILDEWIAFHYHTLRLRHLVVAVDPSSQTSPEPILQRWERLTQLHVNIWKDTDYMPKDFVAKGYYIPLKYVNVNVNHSKWQGLRYQDNLIDEDQLRRDKQRISNHRFRQKVFVAACFRHMKGMGKKLVMHIDTDEYVRLNPFLVRGNKHSRLQFQSPMVQGSTFRAIQRLLSKPRARQIANAPCISMPRLLFGSKEQKSTDHSENRHVSKQIFADDSLFETLRWRYHTAYNDTERNAQPKVMVDVSQVPLDEEMFGSTNKDGKIFSIHRPSKKLCRVIQQLDFASTRKFPLTVNHYLGPWERYQARNDSRRSRTFFELKAYVDDGEDVYVTSWLDGFVEMQGPELARQLLPRQATAS